MPSSIGRTKADDDDPILSCWCQETAYLALCQEDFWFQMVWEVPPLHVLDTS